MDILIWILAGGILGWFGYSHIGFNAARGMAISIIIGAAGGFLGGKVIAPMFSAPVVAGEFSASALVTAAVVAIAFLVAGNFVQNRWRV